MDFTVPEPLLALQSQIRAFIAEQVIPLERDPRLGPHGPQESLRAELIGRARRAGHGVPHSTPKYRR